MNPSRFTQPTLSSLEVEEQTWQFDVRVAESVDESDAVALEYLPRFRRGVSRDKQDTALRVAARLVDDAPGGGRIGVALCLDRDGFGDAPELDDGVRWPSATRPNLDRHARDVTKDSGCLRIQVPGYLHQLSLLHNESENSLLVKQAQAQPAAAAEGRGSW
jgi:hypothetical protein